MTCYELGLYMNVVTPLGLMHRSYACDLIPHFTLKKYNISYSLLEHYLLITERLCISYTDTRSYLFQHEEITI